MSNSARVLRMVDFTQTGRPKIQVGDVVRTGENRYPCYEVIALSGDQAWIRDVQYGTDDIASIGQLRQVR